MSSKKKVALSRGCTKTKKRAMDKAKKRHSIFGVNRYREWRGQQYSDIRSDCCQLWITYSLRTLSKMVKMRPDIYIYTGDYIRHCTVVVYQHGPQP